jgi:hypothetical protein
MMKTLEIIYILFSVGILISSAASAGEPRSPGTAPTVEQIRGEKAPTAERISGQKASTAKRVESTNPLEKPANVIA